MDTARSEADLVLQARGAQASDWSLAYTLTAELRDRFPNNAVGYQIGAAAARELRRFDEASEILAEASKRFADQTWAAAEQSWLALLRGDTQLARQLAADLRIQAPAANAGYQVGSTVALNLQLFDEASAILADSASRFANHAWVATDRASLALARGDADQARVLAEDLRIRFPNNQAGYKVGAAAARSLRQFDGASEILVEAALRFPEQAWVTIEQAWLANVRSDTGLARQLAADLRGRFPGNHAGYQIGAAAARALRQFDEASAILADAAKSFPGQAWVVAEQAWLANARSDANQARQLAVELRSRFPNNQAGYQIGASTARALRKFDEAAALLDEAMRLFADQPWIATEQAWLAHGGGDAERAGILAADLRVRFPNNQAGYQIGAATARASQQFDEASTILEQAVDRFADQVWVAADLARLRFARGEADQAIQLTATLRSVHPDNPVGYQIGATMLRARNQLDAAKTLLDEARTKFSTDPWFERKFAEMTNLTANRADAGRLIGALASERRDLPNWAPNGARKAGKVVVVVGMHRAGTSVCAKIVDRLGFTLGSPLLTPEFDNPDGFQEHQEINNNHEALLAYLGASWDTSWAVRAANEESLQSAGARPIIDRLRSTVVDALEASGGRWAFKDPRTACFLPLWMQIFDSLGVEPLWLLAVRDPRAVAASLYARNRLPLPTGQLLWAEHYLNVLRYLGPRIACVIHYEKWFASGRAQLDRLSGALGVDANETIEYAAEAVRGELMHNAPRPEDTVLGPANEVYGWLCSDPAPLDELQNRAAARWNELVALGAAAAEAGDVAYHG